MNSFYYQKKEELNFRYENFGGLAWFPLGQISKISSNQTGLLHFLTYPRQKSEILKHFSFSSLEIALNEGFVEKIQLSSAIDNSNKLIDYESVEQQIFKASKRKLQLPYWVHIQPFTFCNQNCNHCYCYGNVRGQKFLIPLNKWKEIIDELKSLGVMEIYITGGENLILEDSLRLTDYIVQSGFITGISTNAMNINKRTERYLKKWNFDFIQISVDSVSSKTYDRIRGTKNGLAKVLKNIEKLKSHSNVVINTVVNQWNKSEVEQIVSFFNNLGITNFKFFPQKRVGRAKTLCNFLTEDDWQKIPFKVIVEKYQVNIDYLNESSGSCGSGKVGFSISQDGGIYPCIFGIENHHLRIGSILSDDMELLWFESKHWDEFRKKSNSNLFCSNCEC